MPPMPEYMDVDSPSVEKVEREIDKVQQEVDWVEGKIDRVEGKIDVVEGKIHAVQGKIDAVEGKIHAVELELSNVKDPKERRYLRKEKQEQVDKQKLLAVEKKELTVEKKELTVEKKELAEEKKLLLEEKKLLLEEKKELAAAKKHLAEEKKHLAEEKKLLAEEKLFRLKSKAPIQAASAVCTHVPLSSENQALLDKFLQEELCLPTLENGVPVCARRPSLLLHRLCEQPTQAFEQFLHSATRFSMMVGTSGAGKTRTLYSYLSRNFGLFFVANSMGNGGSADFLSLVEDVAKRLTRPGEQERNADVVTFAVRLLLLTRLEIYLYCLSRGVTPHRWLLIQACCQEMVSANKERPANADVFQLHWMDNFNANGDVFSLPQLGPQIRRVDQLIEELLAREGGHIPPVFLDEAQAITVVDPAQGDYRSSMAQSGVYTARPLAKPVLEGFFQAGGLMPRVIFCGTGFSLYFRSRELASSTGKPITEDDMFTDFGGWTDATQMVNYANGILQVDERVVKIITDDIYPWFYGRFRPFAVLLEQVLLSEKDISVVWQDVVRLFTTARTRSEGHLVSRTYYESVKGLCTSSGDTSLQHLLRETVIQATIQYFYYGRCYALKFGRGDLQAEILEKAVGRLRGETVVVDEPLALLALHNYLADTGDLKNRLESGLMFLNYPSSEGLYWQHLLPLEIQKWWEKENGVMARMALFEGLKLTDTLEEVKEQSSEICKGCIWQNKPPVVVYIADTCYTSLDYLHDRSPRCMFFIAENGAGSDIMWRVKFSSGTTLLFSAQSKLRRSVGTISNVDALKKAAPNAVLTEEWESSIMALLIMYPASRGKLPLVSRRKLARGRTKCTLVVDVSNAHKMIAEDHLRNLDRLKAGNYLPHDRCGVCGQVDATETTTWISCDRCSDWYHIKCVGGDPESAFQCRLCTENNA